jgi:hypothetical protein
VGRDTQSPMSTTILPSLVPAVRAFMPRMSAA